MKTDPMNMPRLGTDKLFNSSDTIASYNGRIENAFDFVMKNQLLSPDTFKRFVSQFKMEDADFEGGWRGEFWGKTMRGACFVYSYNRDKELYSILRDTVIDMMGAGRESEGGRISTYARSHEFCHWDIWSRKYVMLGMQYFYEICDEEELRERLVASMKVQADCIISGIGTGEGKKRIVKATHHWRGLNSSSLLEPIVRLYSLTKEEKYLEFADYIVSEGGCEVENVFELAYKNELSIWQYPITKAYEMTSCFEGLLEYYRIKGGEKYKCAIINYANRILEDDFTVIGSAGCTHELFDHSTVRQANTTNDPIMQETCVTVTLMKFFWQLNLLTGDPRYMDAFETALYNAYLGSLNTELCINSKIPEGGIGEALPFDSYSPLTASTRGLKIGGLKVLSDGHYYGCCACIGAAGIGLVYKTQLLLSEGGVVINHYIDGDASITMKNGAKLGIKTETSYPASGNVKMTLSLEKPEKFALSLRNPAWSEATAILVNGTPVKANSGYVTVEREFSDGDTIELSFDMRTKLIRPIPYGEQILMNKVVWGANYVVPTFDREDPIAKDHIALRRGPLMLCEDEELGYSLDTPISVAQDDEGFVKVKASENDVIDSMISVSAPLSEGGEITLVDYASAGKRWNNGKRIAVWLLAK